MRSIPAALSWEFWHRDRKQRAFLSFLLVSVGVVLLMFSMISMPEQEHAQMAPFLHATLYSVFVPLFTLYASMLAGESSQRFTLPATSWTLAGWATFNGMLAVAGSYVLLAWIANLFGAQWPIIKPAALAACIFVGAHAVSCLLSGSEKWHPFLAFLISMFGCIVTFWLAQRTFNEQGTPFWNHFDVWEAVAVLVTATGGFVLAVASFSLARQGRAESIAQMAMRVLEKLEFRHKVARSFGSGCEAQRWMEWHLKGYSFAAAAAIVVIPLAVWFSSGFLGPKDVVVVISAFTMMGTLGMSLFGLFLGHQGEEFDIKESVAVRPLTDTELADVILLNTAKTLLLGWTVWWVGMGLALACALIAGTAPTTPQEFFELNVPLETWPQVGRYIVGAVLAVLLASWTFASLGATCIVLRAWLFLTLLFVGIGIPASVPFIFSPPIPASVISALQIGYISACIGGTLFAFVMSWRMKLIGTRRVAVSAALCGLLFVGAIIFLRLDPNTSVTYRAMQLSNCVLPFTALAAAPLAVWWNRHR